MNTGQMMLSMFALSLVTMLILSFNKGAITTQDIIIYNKEFIVATTVAQSVLEEISSKAFDETIVEGKSISSAKDFSSKLKYDSGEVYPFYDDVDDYNNFTRTDTIPQMGVFDIEVKCEYLTDGLVVTSSRTYNKKITIRLTSSSLIDFYSEERDTITVSSIFSQWEMF